MQETYIEKELAQKSIL